VSEAIGSLSMHWQHEILATLEIKTSPCRSARRYPPPIPTLTPHFSFSFFKFTHPHASVRKRTHAHTHTHTHTPLPAYSSSNLRLYDYRERNSPFDNYFRLLCMSVPTMWCLQTQSGAGGGRGNSARLPVRKGCPRSGERGSSETRPHSGLEALLALPPTFSPTHPPMHAHVIV
jgi:hypothetical protein